MALEAQGGGVFGVWFGVFPPLEESCPQGSEARMGPLEGRRSREFLVSGLSRGTSRLAS